MENIISLIDNINYEIDREIALDLLTNDKNLFNLLKDLINNEKYKKTIINYFIINNSFSNILLAFFDLTNQDINLWLNEEEINIKLKPLTKEETNELIYKYQQNNDQNARKKLYEHNMGLIKK